MPTIAPADTLVLKRELKAQPGRYSFHKLQIECFGNTGVVAHLEFTPAILGGFNFSRKQVSSRAEEWGDFTATQILEYRTTGAVFEDDIVVAHSVDEPEMVEIARKYAPECFADLAG